MAIYLRYLKYVLAYLRYNQLFKMIYKELKENYGIALNYLL